MADSLIKLLVPDYILDHFEYERWQEVGDVIYIYLVEKNDKYHYPEAIKGKGEISLNGFMNPLELQTFPTKGKEVFLLLKRRRWKLKGSNKSYHNTYSFNDKGIKATKEFGDFLKEIDRIKAY